MNKQKRLKQTKYAWKGTSFKEWCISNPLEVKYSSKEKAHREFLARAAAWDSSPNNLFKVFYSDAITDCINEPSVLTEMLKLESSIYSQPVTLGKDHGIKYER